MKRSLITNRHVKGLVIDLARQIVADEWKPDYIIGISRGGLTPAIMLSHWFNIPMKPLQVSLRDGGECVSDLGASEDAFANKNILIVDDINDSGATFNWIKEDWRDSCHPSNEAWDRIWGYNVRTAVLVHNLGSEFKDIDYHGMEINKNEEDQWMVFPWEEWWL